MEIYNCIIYRMPYGLNKVGKNKYYVYNLLTGRTYSKDPISLDKAKAQIRILTSLHR